MRFYEIFQAVFGRSKETPPAPLSERSSPEYDPENDEERLAYLAKHLAEIAQAAPLLTERYGADFNAFLYRPKLAAFIQKEVVPFQYPTPDGCYQDFLDVSHWPKIHYLNFPGPFYTGESDTCGTGEREAPDNVLLTDHAEEYVFRQPQNFTEFLCVLSAAAVEVFDSYSCDGNDHWTYQLCREWWQGKDEFIRHLRTPAFRKHNGNRIQLYIDYLNGSAETDLRKYCYFLENGRYPIAAEPLPPL